jgi:microcystin-dependent protein
MKTLIFVLGFLAAPITMLAQSAPTLLPFQGRLTDQNGVAISNGVKVVQFKIYANPTGGAPVWAGEVHRTTVNGGLINVTLGSKTPLEGVNFNQQLYLEITVDVSGPGGIPDNAITEADPPMLPRQAILPVVFSKESANARALAGYDWSAIFGVNSPLGPISGSKIQPRSITSAQIASNSITTDLLASQAVTSNQIASGTIGVAQLAAQLVADSLNPPGTVIAWMGVTTNPPPGWELCWGQAVGRADPKYARLFSVIQTSDGTGDGLNTFNLPDLRGLFLRGINASRSDNYADPDTLQRTNSSAGGNYGNQVGSVQADMFKSHTHTYNPKINNYADSSNSGGSTPGSDTTRETLPTGGNETRPKNVYVQYLIKL